MKTKRTLDTRRFMLHLPTYLFEEVEKLADTLSVSYSEVIRTALYKYMKEEFNIDPKARFKKPNEEK